MSDTQVLPIVEEQAQAPVTEEVQAVPTAPEKVAPKKEPVSVAKSLESAKRSLQSDVVLAICSIKELREVKEKFGAVSSPAKNVLGDIAFNIVKKIVEKAVEISEVLLDRKTLCAKVIQAAAKIIAPPTITIKSLEEWKQFVSAGDCDKWGQMIEDFDKSVTELRQTNADWKEASKRSKEDRLVFGKRKNDFAKKVLGVSIRPTLLLRIIKLIIPKHIRAGGLHVGIALAGALSEVVDLLGWAVINGNPKNKKKVNWRLSIKALYNGIQVSEPLKQILGDLLVVGGPLGLLVNSSVPNAAKKRKSKKSKSGKPAKKARKEVEEEEEEQDSSDSSEESDIDDDSSSSSEDESDPSDFDDDEDFSSSSSDEEEEEEEKKRKSKKKSKARGGAGKKKKQQPIKRGRSTKRRRN